VCTRSDAEGASSAKGERAETAGAVALVHLLSCSGGVQPPAVAEKATRPAKKRKLRETVGAAAAAAPPSLPPSQRAGSTAAARPRPKASAPQRTAPAAPSQSDFFSRLSATLPADSWRCGVQCVEMRDSTDLLRDDDSRALWVRLNRDGYLLLRGILPAGDAAAARQQVLNKLATLGAVRSPTLSEHSAPLEGWIAAAKSFAAHTAHRKKDDLSSSAAAQSPEPAKESSSGTKAALLRQGWLVDLRDGVLEPRSETDAPEREWPDVQMHPQVRSLPYHKSLLSAYRTIFRLAGLY